MAGPESLEVRIPLRQGPPVVMHASGVRHPRGGLLGRAASGREAFTPYAELTHVAIGPRGLRIATRSRVHWLRPAAFLEPAHMVVLAHRLRERAAEGPGGAERRQAMVALDARVAGRRAPRLAQGLVLACLAFFALQALFFPAFEFAGAFNGDLVRAGELWRVVTANFLHGSLGHLLLNVLGLFVLGSLLEATVGLQVAAFVVGASALGAMGASGLAGYTSALGASGMVAGIVGALVWLEFRRPQRVPAPWRLSRSLLVGALLADTLLLSFVPSVAHAAHAGGFAAGALAVGLAVPAEPGRPRPGWLPLVNTAAVGGAVAATLALGWSVWSPDPLAGLRRAERLLAIEGLHPEILNNEAWTIAISEGPAPDLLAVARRLAQRAVEQTGRADPNLLDTLAEVLFVIGDADGALAAIDEAIALEPGEPYYREQRRRFMGERAPGDRPDPPDPAPGRLPPLHPGESPGLRV